MRQVFMRAKRGWAHVAFVASETDRDVEYEVKRRDDGHLGCACHSYVFAKGVKVCKHVRAMLGLAASVPHLRPAEVAAPVRVTVQGETFMVTRRAISLGPLKPRSQW